MLSWDKSVRSEASGFHNGMGLVGSVINILKCKPRQLVIDLVVGRSRVSGCPHEPSRCLSIDLYNDGSDLRSSAESTRSSIGHKTGRKGYRYATLDAHTKHFNMLRRWVGLDLYASSDKPSGFIRKLYHTKWKLVRLAVSDWPMSHVRNLSWYAIMSWPSPGCSGRVRIR